MTATEVQNKLIGNAAEHTIKYASSKYGELKSLYPNAFATVESRLEQFSWVSAPLVQTVENAKPLIDQLDCQLSPLVVQLQQRAVLASQQSETLYQVASEKKNEFVQTVRSYQDFAVEQVGQSLKHAQAFTSTQSKQWMHIDLIEYSKTMLDRGKPVVNSMYAMFEIPAPEQTQNPVKQDAAVAKKAKKRAYLRARLYDAIQRARVASSVARQVPGCIYQLIVTSPDIAKQTKHRMKTSDQSVYQELGVVFAVVRNVVEQSLTSGPDELVSASRSDSSPSELATDESSNEHVVAEFPEPHMEATEFPEPCMEEHKASSVPWRPLSSQLNLPVSLMTSRKSRSGLERKQKRTKFAPSRC